MPRTPTVIGSRPAPVPSCSRPSRTGSRTLDLDWFDDPAARPAPQSRPARPPWHRPRGRPGRRRHPPAVGDRPRGGLAVIVAVVPFWLFVIDAREQRAVHLPRPRRRRSRRRRPSRRHSATSTTTTHRDDHDHGTTPGTGSTITVTLPAAGKIKPGDTAPRSRPSRGAEPARHRSAHRRRIYGPLTQQAVSAFQQENG